MRLVMDLVLVGASMLDLVLVGILVLDLCLGLALNLGVHLGVRLGVGLSLSLSLSKHTRVFPRSALILRELHMARVVIEEVIDAHDSHEEKLPVGS